MDLESLTHLIGEVQRIAHGQQILLFGSSSLLMTLPAVPAHTLGVQLTLDADFFLDPDDSNRRQELLNSLGKNRAHHNRTGYYGDFVDLRMTESFPPGWRDRLVAVSGFENVWAFDPTDVAASKVGATASTRLNRRLGRSLINRGMKDIHTVSALLRTKHIELAKLERRLRAMDWEPALVVEADRVMQEILELAGKPASQEEE